MNLLGKYYTLEQLETKSFGAASIVPLIDMKINDSIFEYISIFYNLSPGIKEFLPGFDCSTSEKASSAVSEHALSTHIGMQISYVMCIDGKPIGFIFVNTPKLNELKINFPNWTIDFCIFGPFEGRGFMKGFLPQLMAILKNDFLIDELFAIVDIHNKRSLSLLTRFPFEEWNEGYGGKFINPSTGNTAKVFCCKLSTINFKKE